MTTIHDVYITVHEYAGNCGPVLRCAGCPDWEVDVDGTSLSTAVGDADRHALADEGDSGRIRLVAAVDALEPR